MIIMTAANSVSPTANPFVGATEPLDRVTWSLLMTALPFLERKTDLQDITYTDGPPGTGPNDPGSGWINGTSSAAAGWVLGAWNESDAHHAQRHRGLATIGHST